ncbi:MAG: glutathione S-transferase [Burkholderiales bacterium]
MKLIGSPTSPFVRKVRIVLADKHIDYDFVIDLPAEPNTKVPEFNPLGKIPVLIDDGGNRIFDSSVIVEYLDSFAPANQFIPESPLLRIQVRRWEALADGILDATVLIVQEGRRPQELQSAAWIDRQRGKIARGLDVAERELGDRRWCAGDDYSLADIALGCTLGFLDFRFQDLEWRSSHPNLARHARELFSRKAFEATVPA